MCAVPLGRERALPAGAVPGGGPESHVLECAAARGAAGVGTERDGAPRRCCTAGHASALLSCDLQITLDLAVKYYMFQIL